MLSSRSIFILFVSAYLVFSFDGSPVTVDKLLCQPQSGDRRMIGYIPDARSRILNSSHILLVRVLEAQSGEWSQRAGFGIERRVELTLALDDVLKGQLSQSSEKIRLTVTQADSGTSRDARMPGVWSDLSIAAGSQYVAFGNAPQERSAAQLLTDPKCRLLIPAPAALFDVRLARETPAEENIDDVLAHFRSSAPQVGFLYPDYLLELRGREITSRPGAFGALASILEGPALGGPARTALLENVYNQMNLQAQAPPDVVDRFILALFRLLRLGQASAFHDNIVISYLPVFLPRSSPARVFGRYPGEREQARQSLAGHAGGEIVSRWFDQK
jgi:hypothetical protein